MTVLPPDRFLGNSVRTKKVPHSIEVLAKPTGAKCNLDCAYCFFLDKELLYPDSRFRMSEKLLETYLKQLIESHSSNRVAVPWQGGEPTLRGIEFYRRAIEYQNKHKRPGMVFANSLQTNGTLLDDEWCEFLRENNFLVGMSIDGPREFHDAHRVDKRNRGTFDKVMNGVRLLQKHGVEFNVLSTVNSANADDPLGVYCFIRDEVGARWVQFIPIVERLNSDGTRLRQTGTAVSARSVAASQFGRFLISVFDEWVRRDVGHVFVQTFDAALRNWLGLASSGVCIFDSTCGQALALEHTGDVFSCDHFVEPDYLLGNIEHTHILDLVGSEFQRKFGRDKRDSFPDYCRNCQVRFACHGECPKNRFITTPDGEPGLNYLCAGYKAFFRHIDHPMRIMSDLVRRGSPCTEVMRILADVDGCPA
jgi:uncharacterized protein